jgi:Tripartite tricarboxylate transporter TctB family
MAIFRERNMAIRKELASSLVLMLFGIVFLLYDIKYPLDQWANPGPGVFPLMVGTVWVILAAWQLVQSFGKPGSPGSEEKDRGDIRSVREFLQRNRGESKALLMIAVFITYLLMVKWVGFFISNFFFVITSSRLLGAMDWGRPVALSTGINLFCYFLFEVWLKLSFPRGFLF